MYKVQVDWKLGQNSSEWWNQTCAWVIEEFGLPGGCYTTELTENYMIFNFEDKENAALMLLRWGKN